MRVLGNWMWNTGTVRSRVGTPSYAAPPTDECRGKWRIFAISSKSAQCVVPCATRAKWQSV